MASNPSTIVLVIDRLGAGYLGPYGNTWLETAGWNRLASQALLCEQMLAQSPDLAATYRDYWLTGSESTLPQRARAAGCRAVLVTDDETVAQLPGAADFDELHLMKPNAKDAHRKTPAAEVEETAFLRLLNVALAQLETWNNLQQPQLLWIHARAMQGSWDAPLELRQQFADEDDPPPAEIVEPPQTLLEKNHDPDFVLSITHAYAGQVSVVDIGLQALLGAIDELPQRESVLFAVTAPRGYPLGEHGRIGQCDSALYGELLHVPCCVQFPHGEGALARTQELVTPADLAATIVEGAGWSNAEADESRSLLRIVRGEPMISRDYLAAQTETEQLIRTAAWQLRISKHTEGDRYELYAKPDDRWEFNDVASRAGEIVTQLAELASSRASSELPEELTSPWR